MESAKIERTAVMSNLRTTALDIFWRTLAAIDVEAIVGARLCLDGDQLVIEEEICDLAQFSRVIVIAIGKASLPMARAVERILEDRITDGLVVTNAVIGNLPQLPVLVGGHPLPNAASLEAAARALSLLRRYDAEDTLVLFLISGGGSAMFEQPIDPNLTLDDLQAVNRALVNCGAVINEMNIVRRHLSAVKGGKLAAAAPRSRQISLYVSDVNSDDLTTVASGPTLPDGSTMEDFERIVARHGLSGAVPGAVATGNTENTRSLLLPVLHQQRSSHHLLLDNRRAMLEAKQIAERDFGLIVEIADDLVEGDVETMMQIHIERIAALQNRHRGKAVCLLSGGEVICPVRGDGQGGRNQEFVLRAAIHLQQRGLENVVVLSAGTDGIDGHSPAAGALANEQTLQRANDKGVSAESHLICSDSFNFFNAIGDAILTGPTGNNVRDLRILLAN
jgi:hydroxypyruvate reductase